MRAWEKDVRGKWGMGLGAVRGTPPPVASAARAHHTHASAGRRAFPYRTRYAQCGRYAGRGYGMRRHMVYITSHRGTYMHTYVV